VGRKGEGGWRFNGNTQQHEDKGGEQEGPQMAMHQANSKNTAISRHGLFSDRNFKEKAYAEERQHKQN
jgi:hypothetical protein